MLAIVRDTHGQALSLHRTFLGEGVKASVPNPRKLMPGKLPEGVSVRLSPLAEEIGIAEGIETALACNLELGLPVWSALNANLLSKWVPPMGVRKVHVFADNDQNFTGQEAAHRLAKRLTENGLEAEVHIPNAVGSDWADYYPTSRLDKEVP
jgi:putative DNA primase/helicase